MNILIIEDEAPAAVRLQRMLQKLAPEARILGPLESVKEAVEYLNNQTLPDLLMLDIHLADGLSFEIFNQVKVQVPIIFTTAYDQYALRAFKFNSLHYLVKPIEEEALREALQKFEAHQIPAVPTEPGTDGQANLLSDYRQRYKQRFISRVGDKLIAVNTEDVLFAFSENKGTYLRTKDGRRHLIDFTLEQVEEMLNPEYFFRINRRYITGYQAVDKMINYSNSRLRIVLKDWPDEDIVLSREKTREFKIWLDR